MSTQSESSGRSSKRELLKRLCETGLHHYTSLIDQAHSKGDWTLLKDLSMKFEKDCYSIGEVEMVGKLIMLRMHLDAEPVEKYIVESTLRSIFDLTSNLQEFLIKYLEDSNFKVCEENLQYIMKMSGTEENDYNSWVYNSCCLQ